MDFYVTMGEYDAVAITELPDDQAAAGTLLNAGAMGIAETQTLTAFSEAEVANIVGNLGN